MRREKGIHGLLEKFCNLNLSGYLQQKYSFSLERDSFKDKDREKFTITVPEIGNLIGDVYKNRPLYSIFGVCYAAGILTRVSDDNERLYSWNRDLVGRKVFPKDTLWFHVAIEMNSSINVAETSGIKFQTQKLVKYLLENNITKEIPTTDGSPTQSIAKKCGIDNRRIYEMVTILGHMGLFIVPQRGSFYLSKRYKKVTFPELISRTEVRRQLFGSSDDGIMTRAQKRRKTQEATLIPIMRDPFIGDFTWELFSFNGPLDEGNIIFSM